MTTPFSYVYMDLPSVSSEEVRELFDVVAGPLIDKLRWRRDRIETFGLADLLAQVLSYRPHNSKARRFGLLAIVVISLRAFLQKAEKTGWVKSPCYSEHSSREELRGLDFLEPYQEALLSVYASAIYECVRKALSIYEPLLGVALLPDVPERTQGLKDLRSITSSQEFIKASESIALHMKIRTTLFQSEYQFQINHFSSFFLEDWISTRTLLELEFFHRPEPAPEGGVRGFVFASSALHRPFVDLCVHDPWPTEASLREMTALGFLAPSLPPFDIEFPEILGEPSFYRRSDPVSLNSSNGVLSALVVDNPKLQDPPGWLVTFGLKEEDPFIDLDQGCAR